jgi:hypothetical protein
LIDTTTLLRRKELAFRGHDESAVSDNKGNYIEFADVVARYDEALSSHLESSTVFSGMSKTIQNDLIESVSAVIQEEIKREIVKAPFFSRQVDETTNISCSAQLSIIVRYVDVAGVIQERFLKFFDMSDGRDARKKCQIPFQLRHLTAC